MIKQNMPQNLNLIVLSGFLGVFILTIAMIIFLKLNIINKTTYDLVIPLLFLTVILLLLFSSIYHPPNKDKFLGGYKNIFFILTLSICFIVQLYFLLKGYYLNDNLNSYLHLLISVCAFLVALVNVDWKR